MSCNCENDENKKKSRRSFLRKLSIGLGGLIGAAMSVPLIDAILEPVVGNRKKTWRKIGVSSDFKVGKMTHVRFRNASTYDWSKKIEESEAYLYRNRDNTLKAFKVNCSHLGCPVRWQEGSHMFLCPCHGGAFYSDGKRAAGPPNRPLYQYEVREENGIVELLTGRIPITNIDV
ncbi:(2Fe-2S)-binding protein [Christiangramia fulva]|uniref:(2Fe-2S)-binding protein n=1 Tax=Christiangramia fulva TaxID=2126553 RepID=A0A2R3Z8L8_9FLAO|nr:ubiquinol-cytochrome c reductase iron-sulfur subunit [Christiangramia fulva]AVR46617.1 (2Fe-2S)-binding protein [Christiangramia fulva]